MLRNVLHSKIHRAKVTGAFPDYIGSITIDRNLLEASGMRASDQVTVANCRTGDRLDTYVFEGERGSGKIELNGAAAHLFEPGDIVIIMHYAMMSDEEYRAHRPTVVLMREDNSVDKVTHYEPTIFARGSAHSSLSR